MTTSMNLPARRSEMYGELMMGAAIVATQPIIESAQPTTATKREWMASAQTMTLTGRTQSKTEPESRSCPKAAMGHVLKPVVSSPAQGRQPVGGFIMHSALWARNEGTHIHIRVRTVYCVEQATATVASHSLRSVTCHLFCFVCVLTLLFGS